MTYPDGPSIMCGICPMVTAHSLGPQKATPACSRTGAIRAMAARAAEACFLLRVLGEHSIGRLAARLEEATRERVKRVRLQAAGHSLLSPPPKAVDHRVHPHV